MHYFKAGIPILDTNRQHNFIYLYSIEDEDYNISSFNIEKKEVEELEESTSKCANCLYQIKFRYE